MDAQSIRADFPILQRRVGDKPLIYFDNAATTHKPRQVLRTIETFYTTYNANVHRSPHTLGLEATELYEQAHENVARFIGAADAREIVFVRNSTEAINLVAYSLLSGENERLRLQEGDQVVVTVMEHHSDLVPWQRVCAQAGATLKVIDIRDDGTLDMEQLSAALTERTRLVCCAHGSNVLGTINPVQEIGRLAHQAGALFLVDGAQSVPHMPVDVKQIGCDFLAFSGHKMLAPMDIGVLYGKRELLQEMSPFLYGGEMVADVTLTGATWKEPPWKFEAGTANVCGGIALGGATDLRTGQHLEGAVDYLERISMAQVRAHERALTRHALQGLRDMERVRVYGPLDADRRGGILAFAVEGSDAHLVAHLLNDEGIAVRAGGLCAYPLADRLGVAGTVRASFYIYNTEDEVDRFLEVLEDIVRCRLL
ncbi:MAG: SufS family cysteine desulfurase [Anaerolineae bacterium]|nr:SufS family cysteine desulfurase [Anaerolineae bacterium]